MSAPKRSRALIPAYEYTVGPFHPVVLLEVDMLCASWFYKYFVSQ